MQVILNGKPRDIEAKTLARALAEIELGDAIVATAVNGKFVPARARPTTALADGDRIEVVAPMQGG